MNKPQAIIFSIIILLFTAMVWASPVPDTGVTQCYDVSGNVITCPSPGQPFYGQDANFTINPMSYTKLDTNGNALPDSTTSRYYTIVGPKMLQPGVLVIQLGNNQPS